MVVFILLKIFQIVKYLNYYWLVITMGNKPDEKSFDKVLIETDGYAKKGRVTFHAPFPKRYNLKKIEVYKLK